MDWNNLLDSVETLAEKVTSPHFGSDVKDVANTVAELVQHIHSLANELAPQSPARRTARDSAEKSDG